MEEHEKLQSFNGEENLNQPEDRDDKNIDREEPISSEDPVLPETAADTTTEQTSTLNTQLSTEQEMEVHHHTHASHGKKTWKSYFWEFLMLFLAVFCGFLAEYALEHKIEADRELQYMESLSEDLRRDTSNINNEYKFVQKQKDLIDSLIEIIYYQPLTGENINRLYLLHFSGRALGMSFEYRTTLQLKNAGGMRLLRNKTTVDSILNYWNRIETMEFVKERIADVSNQIGDLSVRIFHTKFIIPGDAPLDPPKAIRKDAILIDNDARLLAEYVNRQFTKRGRMNNYLRVMLQTKMRASNLLETIRKEYHLK